jgi:hypothetical protein
MSFEVVFKRKEEMILTLHNLVNRTSAMEAIKTHRNMRLSYDSADIFEILGRLRYLIKREKFHK